MKLNQVINTINKFAENVKAEAKKNLQKKSSTGSLKESINYKLTDTEKGFILSFFGTEYADFIDKGVKGAINQVQLKINKENSTPIQTKCHHLIN